MSSIRRVDLSGDRKLTQKTVDRLHADGFHRLADLAQQYVDDRPSLLARLRRRLTR